MRPVSVHEGRRRLLTAAATASALALCGCGSIVIEYELQADITVRDEAGALLPAGEVITLPKTGPSISFPSKQYRGAELEWSFSGLPGAVANRTDQVLCLQYDRVELASTDHRDPIPLSVYSWVVGRGGKLTLTGKGKAFPPFIPPALCLQPHEEAFVSFHAEMRDLFPSGRMFNASEPRGGDLAMADKGIGNWITMRLPYTVGEKRRVMDVKLTALDSKARTSYY